MIREVSNTAGSGVMSSILTYTAGRVKWSVICDMKNIMQWDHISGTVRILYIFQNIQPHLRNGMSVHETFISTTFQLHLTVERYIKKAVLRYLHVAFVLFSANATL